MDIIWRIITKYILQISNINYPNEQITEKTRRSITNPNTEYHEQTLHELNMVRNLHNSFSFTPPPSPCSVTTPDPLSRTTSVASYSKTYSNPATPRLSSKQESWSPWRTKKKPTSSTDSVFTHSPQHKNNNRSDHTVMNTYPYVPTFKPFLLLLIIHWFWQWNYIQIRNTSRAREPSSRKICPRLWKDMWN